FFFYQIIAAKNLKNHTYPTLLNGFSLMPELDEMGTRIDDLEKNVADLMTQAGAEEHYKSKQVPWIYFSQSPNLNNR
uniref:Uncharacterized protein n=1 Tax=Sinocyclocheilus grahami TaxID=75366 RepID=A0A672SUK4_SINGR